MRTNNWPWCLFVLLLSQLEPSAFSQTQDTYPLADVKLLEKPTAMIEVPAPIVIGIIPETAMLPAGVKALFVGLPKGVSSPGVVRVDRGQVLTTLAVTTQVAPGNYPAKLLLVRGKERVEGAIDLQVAPFELYAAIGRSIRFEIPKGQPVQLPVGQGFAYAVEIVNVFPRPLLIPPNNGATVGARYPIGVVQRWIERLEPDSTLPHLPAGTSRKGNAYAAGGEQIGNTAQLLPGRIGRTMVQYQAIRPLQPGKYRLTFEFIPATDSAGYAPGAAPQPGTTATSLDFEVVGAKGN